MIGSREDGMEDWPPGREKIDNKEGGRLAVDLAARKGKDWQQGRANIGSMGRGKIDTARKGGDRNKEDGRLAIREGEGK